jgi:hypothetical protein
MSVPLHKGSLFCGCLGLTGCLGTANGTVTGPGHAGASLDAPLDALE